MASHLEVLGVPRACSISPLVLEGPCQVPMEALVDQWVHVSWVPHLLLEEVIPSGMAQVTLCEVAQCVGVQDLDPTIEAEEVVEEMSHRHLLHSEEPEEVVLEEDPQMAGGVLVEEAWLEVVGTAHMKALVGAWAAAVDIAPMKDLAEEWAVDIAPMMGLVEAWVEVVDIVPMMALDTGDPTGTGHMMALVIEAMTIEGHHLMSTEVTMAMVEEATEGMMEATVMEETCRTAPSAGIS